VSRLRNGGLGKSIDFGWLLRFFEMDVVCCGKTLIMGFVRWISGLHQDGREYGIWRL
jgi:hypothetical protein